MVENAQQAGEQKLIILFETLVRKSQGVLKCFWMEELPDPFRNFIISVPRTRPRIQKSLRQLLVRRLQGGLELPISRALGSLHTD